MKKALASMLPDMLMVVGVAAIAYGAWAMYAPAGFVVGGAFLVCGGVMAARAE